VMFGLFVAATMTMVRRRHQQNMRDGNLPAIPTESGH
jgi:hypothetical protein